MIIILYNVTFKCGHYNVFKEFLKYFFAYENMKKTDLKSYS
jgi:hypothetical protein